MTYEWESKVTKEMLDEIHAILPEGLDLMGVAVCQVEDVEAALILYPGAERGMVEADARKDIFGDAERQYKDAQAGILGAT